MKPPCRCAGTRYEITLIKTLSNTFITAIYFTGKGFTRCGANPAGHHMARRRSESLSSEDLPPHHSPSPPSPPTSPPPRLFFSSPLLIWRFISANRICGAMFSISSRLSSLQLPSRALSKRRQASLRCRLMKAGNLSRALILPPQPPRADLNLGGAREAPSHNDPSLLNAEIKRDSALHKEPAAAVLHSGR